ncbi:MAG: MXAN_6640 family putative metalloprotease [Myxococcota bacterium]
MRSRPTLACGLSLAAWLGPSVARAEPRPPAGGIWGFDPADVIESWAEPTGQVRVHYSVEGPNSAPLSSNDGDMVPDYAQLVATTTADALGLYVDDFGFDAPTAEADDPDLGGDAAIDVYLVDFGGAADGRYGSDDCAPSNLPCSGFIVLENDFSGYGYPSTEVAVRIVASHELFHAVQAAYVGLPVWISEGTATWATRRYDSTLPDFVNACAGYLINPNRTLYEPPLGPVPSFAYGSALWWDFVDQRLDEGFFIDLFVALADSDDAPEQVMATVLEDSGDPLLDAWPVFSRFNLAIGPRSGVATSHEYAAQLPGIDAIVEGPVIDRSLRLFPLSTEYWRIDHEGGPLVFGADEALDHAVFSLHPVADFAADGVVGDAIDEWEASEAGHHTVGPGDLPEGGYWIVVSRPVVADSSTRARVCVGPLEHVEACEIDPIPEEPEADSGSGDGPADDTTTTGDSDEATTGSTSSAGMDDEGGSGCACRTSPSDGGPEPWPVASLLSLLVLRRRVR